MEMRVKKVLLYLVSCFLIHYGILGYSGPTIIGQHDFLRTIETPHPYPGSKSEKPEAVWSDYIEYKEAKYIVIEFKRFELDDGDWVEITDREGKQKQVFKGLGFLDSGGDFITKMIFGNYAKITLYSSNPKPHSFGYLIQRVTRGYTDEELAKLYGSSSEPESICGTDDKQDAKCFQSSYPDIYNASKAVCRIVMDGSALCTGWLVSCENHLITNNHCTWDDDDFDTQGELNRMEFQFMYEDPTCGGSGATVEYSFMGGTWLENDHNIDFTLIQAPAGENPAATYGYLKWDLRVPNIDEQIYITGHPSGRPKEISLLSTDASDQSGFAEIYSVTEAPCVGGTHQELGYMADTEGGNSGSPVIARSNNKAIGLHHCGGCPNSGLKITDVYNKIQESPPYLPSCTTSSFVGVVEFSQDLYGCASQVTISVEDESSPPLGSGTINVSLWSDTETTPENVLLTESPANSGKFSGTFTLFGGTPQHGDNKLSVSNGDQITVLYVDADDGQGGSNIPRYDYADIDCQGPVISNVAVSNIKGTSALITWNTNENANSRVTYGTAVPPSTNFDDLATYVTSHSVNVTGLTECTTYYFSVTSSDAAGNSASDDNNGNYYTFTTGMNVTPEYDSTDVP
ncbi:MAG: trypsin-like peptidase domain-containing protein, partial [Acidobacteriota bacterium]